MAAAASAEGAGAPGYLNPAGSSRPPSSAGSTIDDPDMTDDEVVNHENRLAQTRNVETQSTAAETSNAGTPEPNMNLTSKTHSFETPSRNGDKPARSSGRKGARRSRGGARSSAYSFVHERPANGENGNGDDEESVKVERGTRRGSDIDPKSAAAGAATVVGTRRQANGTIGSVYSGNKIRHLKKEDGVPLWRKDIQYTFLKAVFDDEQPVFTRISDSKKDCSFADIYIDAMARSSKTSKILKDKLQQDKAAAKNMAMICLLVNVGRMNTTLNFFPEMRAQLRTYHSIPSLQAHADASAYKQLQDAPRLKSILKGASEDTEEPRTIDAIEKHPIPRTNPVNLIFVLSQYAPKISELHFFPPQDFFDLVMRHTISSKSRAKAFLWLMWWYLESDFSREAALKNPFGPGILGDPSDPIPLKVPEFEPLTEEQGDAENVDTSDEIEFGRIKQNERKRILEEDDPTTDRMIKKLKKSAGENGTDHESSPAPKASVDPSSSRLGGQAESLEDDWEPVNPHPGRGRYKRPTKKEKEEQRTSLSGRPLHRTAKAQIDRDTPSEAAATPQPPGSSAHPVLHQFTGGADQNSTPVANTAGTTSRRPRPLTQHQLAVEAHRRSRVEYILAHKKQDLFNELEEKRESQNWLARAAKRIERLPDGYDSEDEENSWGMGGLIANRDGDEEDDFGEEAEMWARVFRRAYRRLGRWSGDPVAERPKRERPRKSSVTNIRPLESSPAPSVARATPSGTTSRRRGGGGGGRRSNANKGTPTRAALAAAARRRRQKAKAEAAAAAKKASALSFADGELPSSQVGADSDAGVGLLDEEGNEGDVDGEDVTMMLEEELNGRRGDADADADGDEDDGEDEKVGGDLDDIDRDLLAEGDEDGDGEVEIEIEGDETEPEDDEGEGDDMEEGEGDAEGDVEGEVEVGGSDVDMDGE